MNQVLPSWNQVRDWLRELELLRQASRNSPVSGSEASRSRITCSHGWFELEERVLSETKSDARQHDEPVK